MNLGKITRVVKLTITEVVVAYLTAIINGGGSVNWFELAQIILAIKLNVFSVPLMLSPALRLPLWVTYVVVVVWIYQWFLHSQGDLATEVNTTLSSIGGELRDSQ